MVTTRWCSPSRWGSAPVASESSLSAAFRKGSSRWRHDRSRFSPMSAGVSSPRSRACAWRCLRTPWTASATCSTRPSPGRPSASSSATAAPTRRATSRCPHRFSMTSASCLPRRGLSSASAGCWPTSCGLPARHPPSASAGGHRRRRGRQLPPASPRRASGGSARLPDRGCATPRSSPPEPWRPTVTARSSGWSRASCVPAPLEPEPDPIARGNLIHATLEQLLADLDGPVTPESLHRAQRDPRSAPVRARERPRRPARCRPSRDRPRRAAAGDRSRPAALPAPRGQQRRGLAAVWPRAALRL